MLGTALMPAGSGGPAECLCVTLMLMCGVTTVRGASWVHRSVEAFCGVEIMPDLLESSSELISLQTVLVSRSRHSCLLLRAR